MMAGWGISQENQSVKTDRRLTDIDLILLL